MFGHELGILISHWCVMIDNNCYSLDTDNGSSNGIIIINKTEDKNYENWIYFGERK